jgi:predicted ATPase/DNA-binding winged helix-turn-helix (wHTH) protein
MSRLSNETRPGCGGSTPAPTTTPGPGVPTESADSAPLHESPLCFDGFEIRPAERRLIVQEHDLTLRAKAYDLLLVLAERRHRIVGKSELLDLVWPGLVVEENNLAVQISTLRKALGPGVIATIPGHGYRFTAAEVMPAGTATLARVGTVQADAATTPAGRPLHAPSAPTGNLPHDIEALLGRDDDITALVDLLGHHRLVTLVGAGGLGKTRLARAVARALQPGCTGGAWWVDLAPLNRDDQVAHAVAHGVGLPLGEGDAPALLARALATRPATLLVLDNCEQVAAGVAGVVAAVLGGAPAVRVLATSQLPLHLGGEQVWRLDALAVPEQGMALEDARRHGAFALFEQRARAADQRFTLAGPAVEQAITLCRRLGGHALAIEMAAARAPQIGLSALLDQLGRRLDLLRSQQHQGLPRQQSLRATLDWSCSLLDPAGCAVLRRLGVLAGAFGLEAAQQIGADTKLDAWQVLDALAVLVERGLVQLEQYDPPRYRLAETTRLYAVSELAAQGETAAVTERHGQALARLAQQGHQDHWQLTQDDWLARYASDHDDLRLAFDNACARSDAAVAAETGQMLYLLDSTRGIVAGMRERMAAAHRLLRLGVDHRVRGLLSNLAAPHFSIALTGIVRLDVATVRRDAWRKAGDDQQLYLALRALAGEYARAGDFAQARATADEMAALEDPRWPAPLRIDGAQVDYELGRYLPDEAARGAAGLRRGLVLAAQFGDARREARLRFFLADEITSHGDPAEAIALGHAAIEALRPYVRPAITGATWSNLCAAFLLAGDDEQARRAAAQALPLMRPQLYAGILFNHLALLALRAGQPDLAARLLGHAERWYRDNQNPRPQATEARLLQILQPALDQALAPGRCTELRAQGADLSDHQADALAWQLLDPHRS